MIEPGVARRRITLAVVLAALAAAGGRVPSLSAGHAVPPPTLATEHHSPTGAFTFRTPSDWVVENSAREPETIDASGSGVRVRFVHRPGDYGYDSLHGACMLERLAPPMETSPIIKYEYDYVGGPVGDRRALDSAFVIRYDNPVHGHTEWRQRNVAPGHGLRSASEYSGSSSP